MIPKIIHYCWLGEDEYPPLVRKCIASWHEKMPDWEYRLWDKKCLDEIDVPWVHEAYKAKVFSHAADYIRLYAVYKYGGFYFDSDVEVLKDFSPLTVLPYVIGHENGTGYIEAATFGAEAGNAYIKKCMEWYHDKHFVNADGSYNYKMTITRMMKETLEEFITINSIEVFDNNKKDIQLFSPQFFSPKNGAYRKLTDLTENTYSIHHFRNSWMPFRSKFATFIWRHFGDRVYLPMIAVWKRIKTKE